MNHPPKSATAQASPAPAATSPLPTRAANGNSEVRDELVRAVMPELRVLMEHLVKTAVESSTASLVVRQRELEAKLQRPGAASPVVPHELEAAVQRAVAPLLDKQRELEAELRDLRRAQLPPAGAASLVAQRPPEAAISPPAVVAAPRAPAAPPWPIPPTVSAAPRPVAVVPRAAPPRAIELKVDPEPLLDIPAALNGSRRKRVVVWLLALGVVLLLASVAGLAALSHSGKYL